jgi:hypothetical protein
LPAARDADQRDVVKGNPDGAVYHGFDRHPRLYLEALLGDGTQCLVKVRDVDFGEEPELTQVHTQDRNLVGISQPQRTEHGPIPAQTDQQVDVFCDPVLLEQLDPQHAVQLTCETKNRNPPRAGPAGYQLNGQGAVTSGV